MSVSQGQPTVSLSAVAAAGLASATAALITSRFGVAGTLIGAALTTMIITGGSTILSAYLDSVSGKVRKVPSKVRARASRIEKPTDLDGDNVPGRPDLINNSMGRMRAAFDWFSKLSPLRRRSILLGALIPALIAFLIGIGTITGVELASGKSLSCGVWSKCPSASARGNGEISGTRPSIFGGGEKASSNRVVEDQPSSIEPGQNDQQLPEQQGPDSNVPQQQAAPQQQASPQQQDAPQQQAPPQQQPPADSGPPVSENPAVEEPIPAEPALEQPVPEEPSPEQPAPAGPTPVPNDGSDSSDGAAQESAPAEP